jgi:LPS sulfotransferase NodH
MVKPIFICGQQRSGTTALQSALSHVDSVKNLGEIFKIDEADVRNKQNFYYYFENVLDNKLIIRTLEQAEREFLNYLDYLSELCPGSHCVIDIKYNFWHHFNPGWLHFVDCPPLLFYCKKNKFPIIHVTRNDVFSQYVSHQYALASNKWHYVENEASLNIEPFKINCPHLANYFKLVDANVALFRESLRGYDSGVELIYEELFDGIELKPASKQKLSKALPEWIVNNAKSSYVKNKANQLRKIANPEEVIDYFRNTQYGVMVIDALRPPLAQKE